MTRLAVVVERAVPARLGTSFRWLLASSWTTNLGDGIALAAGALLVASLTEILTDPTDHVGLKCYGLYPTADRDGDPLVEHWCINTRAHRTASGSAGGDGGEVDEAARAERRRIIANNKAWDSANDVRTAWLTSRRASHRG